MLHDVRIIAASEFLRTTVAGAVDYGSSEQILQQIAAACREHDQHHVLIDALNVPERSLSVLDLYQLGSNLPAFGFGPTHRIAIVCERGDNIERAKFFELVAVNRGASVRAFDKLKEALEWLNEGASSGGSAESTRSPASAC